MADDVKFTVGADTKGVKAGLQGIKGEMDKLKRSAGGAFGTFENENKVKRNLLMMARDLGNVTTAGEAAAVIGSRIGDSMKLGLAGGVATAFIGKLIEIGSEGQKAFEELIKGNLKFRQELQKTFSSGNFTAIIGGLEGIEAQSKAISEAFAQETAGKGWMHRSGMFVNQIVAGGKSAEERLAKLSEMQKDLSKRIEEGRQAAKAAAREAVNDAGAEINILDQKLKLDDKAKQMAAAQGEHLEKLNKKRREIERGAFDEVTKKTLLEKAAEAARKEWELTEAAIDKANRKAMGGKLAGAVDKILANPNQTLPEMRKAERDAELERDKAAGRLARDIMRQKYGTADLTGKGFDRRAEFAELMKGGMNKPDWAEDMKETKKNTAKTALELEKLLGKIGVK